MEEEDWKKIDENVAREISIEKEITFEQASKEVLNFWYNVSLEATKRMKMIEPPIDPTYTHLEYTLQTIMDEFDMDIDEARDYLAEMEDDANYFED